ncbi:MAG: cobalt ECF transporter T component CbiQ [Pseudomonadota bacterium]
MLTEDFSGGTSFAHRLDPRVKLLAAMAYSVVVVALDRPAPLLAALAASVLMAAAARLPLRQVARRLAFLNLFSLSLLLTLPFTTKGEVLLRVGPLAASAKGLGHATLVALKSNAVVLALLALLATSSVMTLAHALNHLWVPAKLVHLTFFTWRYVHVLHAEYFRLTSAMKIRCFRPRTNLHTYRAYAYLVGMLLLRSFTRSQRVHQAMLCRGFSNGTFWLLEHFELRPADMAAAACLGAATAGLAMWGLWA